YLATEKREEAPKHFPPQLLQTYLFSLLQEAQHRLRQLVGLGQDRGTSLLQDLVLAQRSGFGGVVGILDTATGCRDVFTDILQVGDGVLETVLYRTELGTLRVDGLDRLIDGLHCNLGTFGRSQINFANLGWGAHTSSGPRNGTSSETSIRGCSTSERKCRLTHSGAFFRHDSDVTAGFINESAHTRVGIVDGSSNLLVDLNIGVTLGEFRINRIGLASH